MLSYTLVRSVMSYPCINNINLGNYYVLAYEGKAYVDDEMANKLNVIYLQYINILETCNAELIGYQYYFKNEDDAIKAIVMIKLIM